MCNGKGTRGKAQVGDTEDRISRLPDVLLTYILSFLSTKTSVRTCVLSTRWRPLWASVPCLKLSNSDFLPRGEDLKNRIRRKVNFLTFVVQFLRRSSPCYIRKLHLYVLAGKVPSEISSVYLVLSQLDPLHFKNKPLFTGEMSLNKLSCPSNLELWIHVAKEFRVLNLKISCPEDEEVLQSPHLQQSRQFPPNLFTCETLVVLKLKGHMVLNLPMASNSFPNLKVLKLKDIIFRDDNSASNLINSSCPMLEKLVIRRIDEGDNLHSLVVTAQTLKRLNIEFVTDDISSTLSRTLIDAPGLEYLQLIDGITYNYVAGDLGALVEANLDVSLWDASCLFKLLTRISNVQKLTLSDSTLVSLEQAKSYDLPIFNNLTCLKITEVCDDLASWEMVVEVLKSSPRLENLFLKGLIFDPRREFDWTAEQDMPNCLASYLKRIEISFIYGEEDELEIVQYFIKHSRVLEEMKILIDEKCPEKAVIKKEILAFPKGSVESNIDVDYTPRI